MKNVTKLVLVAGLCSMTIGCGEDTPRVSVQQLDEQIGIVRDNTLFNAKVYQMEDPRLAGYKAIPNGDSTISAKCPQGDGWGTIMMVNLDTNVKLKLKCSTYSKNVACQLEEEFKYGSEEGQCAPLEKVPYPITKLAN